MTKIKVNRGTQIASYSFGIYLHNWGYPIANEWEVGIYFFKWFASYSFGIYLHNWGYPIANEWEVGIYFFKWYIGVELFR